MEAKAREAEERIDYSSSKDEALKAAILATEMYMKAIKVASTGAERERLKSRCMRVLARAEEIKLLESWDDVSINLKSKGITSREMTVPYSDRTLPTREKIIILESSKLHGFIFSPWISEPEEELFQASSKNGFFVDAPDLKLSRYQQQFFDRWKRPEEAFRGCPLSEGLERLPEINNDPTMTATNDIDLVQDVTADCSVVASLCALTARPGHDFEKLLCTTFHPYNREKNEPIISKSGRYIFRLHFNGCARKVIIDDRLPCSKSTRTLHVVDRQNPGLLWPALLEKAYLKIHGGYDFPGSNSGTDLWVMTGWIPEQIFLHSDELNRQQIWDQIFNSHSSGDVILSLGTGRLSRIEEEGLGLAGEHDYAVMDLKESNGQQLLLVKNPWCDGTVWKGATSIAIPNERSTILPKDKDGPHSKDKSILYSGTFWIPFTEVLQNFESLYLNWNPGLYRFRQDHHFSWTIPNSASPACFTHNPQYSMSSVKGGPVSVLLSRHFSSEEHVLPSGSTSTKTARRSSGFISVHVCEADGMRVHLSDTIFRGPFVDSPQTLIRLDMPEMACYTLVITQQDLPLRRYSFTLSAYSQDPVRIDHASDPYPYHKSIPGAWTLRTAGGNANSSTYPSNPQFRISIPSLADIVLLLETDQLELPVHLKMVWAGGERVSNVTARNILAESGEYMRGFALAKASNVPPGIYTIICSTFEQGQTGPFMLRVESTIECEVRPIANEAAGRLSFPLPIVIMRDGVERMLAPVAVSRLTKIKVIARHCRLVSHSYSRAKSPLKVSLERGQGPNKTTLGSSCEGEFSDAPAGVRIGDIELGPQAESRECVWLVVERYMGDTSVDEIEVEVLSEAPIEVGSWGFGDG